MPVSLAFFMCPALPKIQITTANESRVKSRELVVGKWYGTIYTLCKDEEVCTFVAEEMFPKESFGRVRPPKRPSLCSLWRGIVNKERALKVYSLVAYFWHLIFNCFVFGICQFHSEWYNPTKVLVALWFRCFFLCQTTQLLKQKVLSSKTNFEEKCWKR